MGGFAFGWGVVGAAIGFAFVFNYFAELILLNTDKKGWVALAKSVKAIVIPALIAGYAIIAAGIISGGNG